LRFYLSNYLRQAQKPNSKILDKKYEQNIFDKLLRPPIGERINRFFHDYSLHRPASDSIRSSDGFNQKTVFAVDGYSAGAFI